MREAENVSNLTMNAKVDDPFSGEQLELSGL